GRKTLGRGEFEEKVRDLSLGLLTLGVGRGERVAILLENSPEWIITDLAISSIGAVSVPVYTTLSPEETAFVLEDSGSTAVVFSPHHIKKLLQAKCPSLKHFIATAEVEGPAVLGTEVLTLGRVAALGRESGDPELWEARMRAVGRDDPFSIIYTSGTTGRSKGVVLSHGNILSNIEAVGTIISVTGRDLHLSYLPLSHIFERMVHHLMIYKGGGIAYSRGFAYAGADIRFFRPTLMVAVPFFLDRIRAKVLEGIEKAGGAKKLLFRAAMRGGASGRLLDGVALRKIRERIAPGLRFFISGGAKLPKDTAEFFRALGMPVIEGYGLTETSPVVSMNTPEDVKIGSVGRPAPGVELRIKDDGEIVVRGPGVMKGYFNMPEATSEAVRDGWFHTGDIGFVDPDGFLTITDRKKDLIITSVGKNIAPQRIEAALRADECIKEALVYGDGRPHLVAVIVPDKEGLDAAGIRDEERMKFYEKRIHANLKPFARFEQIRRFALVDDELIREECVTPTMKLKRAMVAEKFRDIIDGLYEVS
ncbi:MAG: long-chain fatty acid--CoA ligase, partial [Thermodesulfobacteriota bacterium]